MNRILAVMFLLLAGTAHADQAPPPIPGTPPPGWVKNTEHAKLVHNGILVGLPGDLAAANVRVYSYNAPKDPSRGGAQLIFSVVDAAQGDDASAAAYVRARVDELKNTAQVMVNDGGGRVRNITWQEHTDDANRVVDALLEWAHDDNGTQSLVRAAWVKLAGSSQPKAYVIEEVRAECVMAADAVATLRPACAEALASMLLPEVAARLPITAAAAVEPVAATTAVAEAPSMKATPPGTPVPARPVVQRSPERDWRAFYVLGALIVLGAVLMWNKRRREEYDEEADHKRDEAEAHEDHEEDKP